MTHSDKTRIDVLYSHFILKDKLEDIANTNDVNYNTVRNFINSFRTETGMKYKHLLFDTRNPILLDLDDQSNLPRFHDNPYLYSHDDGALSLLNFLDIQKMLTRE